MRREATNPKAEPRDPRHGARHCPVQSGFAYRDRVFHETLCALQLQYIIDTTDSEEVRYSLTQRFCDLMDIPLFSLSPKNENCADMTTAREFLAG